MEIPAKSVIKIVITVKETKLGHYQGKILLKSDGYKSIKLNYFLSGNCIYEKDLVDIKYFFHEKEVHIKGLYKNNPKLYDPLTEKEKRIHWWGFNLIISMIDNSILFETKLMNYKKDTQHMNIEAIKLIFEDK